MASCRFLNLHSFYSNTLIICVIAIFSVSCGTSKRTTKSTNNTPSKTTPPKNSGNTEKISASFISALKSNRSKLSDVYSSENNDVPDFLMSTSDDSLGDPNRGFRIQILSTRDVAQADTVAKQFRSWAAKNMKSYIPKAYVFFRQPYYKVHVGNFQFHSQAIKLNQELKKRYPGAWVVNDEINPDLVPADTTLMKDQSMQ